MKQIILFSLILIFSLNTFSQHNISVYKATYKTVYDDQYIKEYILVTVEDDNIYIVADHGETYITAENIRPDSRTINESTIQRLEASKWGYGLSSSNEKIVVSDDYSKIALENDMVEKGFVIFEKTNLQYRFAHCSYSDIRNIRNEPHDEAEILGKADLSTANVQLLSIYVPYIITKNTDGIESVKGQGCWYKAIIDGIEGYVWAEICFGELDLVEK